MAKKHLALLIPHTDVMLESDFRAALPEEWVCHACRMYLEEVGEEAEKRMVDEGVPSALKTLRGIVPFDGVASFRNASLNFKRGVNSGSSSGIFFKFTETP